jgi:hypothetical protein
MKGVEEAAFPSVTAWLQSSYGLETFADVRSNVTYQAQDVDLIAKDHEGNLFSVEVKIRQHNYSDILVETYSNWEYGTTGNFFTSEADLYAYVVYQDGQLGPAYLLHFPSLREWFGKNRKRYRARYAANPPENPVFHSEFFCVPVEDIPLRCFIPKEEQDQT